MIFLLHHKYSETLCVRGPIGVVRNELNIKEKHLRLLGTYNYFEEISKKIILGIGKKVKKSKENKK